MRSAIPFRPATSRHIEGIKALAKILGQNEVWRVASTFNGLAVDKVFKLLLKRPFQRVERRRRTRCCWTIAARSVVGVDF